jgi:hypothetical protein
MINARFGTMCVVRTIGDLYSAWGGGAIISPAVFDRLQQLAGPTGDFTNWVAQLETSVRAGATSLFLINEYTLVAAMLELPDTA